MLNMENIYKNLYTGPKFDSPEFSLENEMIK